MKIPVILRVILRKNPPKISTLRSKLTYVWTMSGLKHMFITADCGIPMNIDRAEIDTIGNTLEGTTRRYTCATWTVAEGTPTITCQEDGLWTTTDLYCRRKTTYAVDGLIFVGTDFLELNKNNKFMGLKFRFHSILLHDSYRNLRFRRY